jgi:hypothetical protein
MDLEWMPLAFMIVVAILVLLGKFREEYPFLFGAVIFAVFIIFAVFGRH